MLCNEIRTHMKCYAYFFVAVDSLVQSVTNKCKTRNISELAILWISMEELKWFKIIFSTIKWANVVIKVSSQLRRLVAYKACDTRAWKIFLFFKQTIARIVSLEIFRIFPVWKFRMVARARIRRILVNRFKFSQLSGILLHQNCNHASPPVQVWHTLLLGNENCSTESLVSL